MDALRYPDSGQPLEDANILRNAVHFSTAQRAFAACSILWKPLETLPDQILTFLAVEAFMCEMTSTEDVLGWMLALEGWKPGDVNHCLLRLLDNVQVDPKSEEKARSVLDSLDASGLRVLLHIPPDAELNGAGFPGDVRNKLNEAIPANLDSLRRLTELRQRADRGYVVAFNKLKHLLVAIRTDVRGSNEVLVPKWRGVEYSLGQVRLQNAWIGCTPQDVRVMAARAVIAQAVLNSLLGMILWIRFGEAYSSPPWVVAALGLPGWYEEPAA